MYFHSSPERDIWSRNHVLNDNDNLFYIERWYLWQYHNNRDIPRPKRCVYDTLETGACRAWYTLNGECTNVLNNDLPQKCACAEGATYVAIDRSKP